ncbi:MAG TPA: hypothetical protein VNT58_08110 [Gaiellaceae bacterium]|nr:hypothetical protein [Gaiellaceae bacterium]
MRDRAQDPHVSVLRLRSTGDLVQLRAQLAVRCADPSTLIVDLTEAESLDPATAALLVDGIARYEEREGTCLLLVPETCPQPVRDPFERNGLSALLPIVRSWDEALRRAARQPDEPGWTSPLS